MSQSQGGPRIISNPKSGLGRYAWQGILPALDASDKGVPGWHGERLRRRAPASLKRAVSKEPARSATGSRPSWPPVVMWDQMWDRELTRTHKPQKKFTKLP